MYCVAGAVARDGKTMARFCNFVSWQNDEDGMANGGSSSVAVRRLSPAAADTVGLFHRHVCSVPGAKDEGFFLQPAAKAESTYWTGRSRSPCPEFRRGEITEVFVVREQRQLAH